MSKSANLAHLVLPIIIIYCLFFLVSFYIIDPDFGWHLKSGEYIAHEGLPRTDIFTYTAQDFPWVNHEWLGDLITYLIYERGGYALLALFSAFLWTGALILAPGRFLPWPVYFLAAAAISPFVGIRPMAWSVMLLVLLVRFLRRPPNRVNFTLIPLLFLAWANLHGSFTLGLLILAGRVLIQKRFANFLILLLSLFATFINPYGYGVYQEVFRTASDSSLKWLINEWMPLNLPWPSALYFLAFSCFFLLEEKKRVRSLFTLPGFLFALALSAIRHAPYFILLSLSRLDQYARHLSRHLQQAARPARTPHAIQFLISVASVYAGFIFFSAILMFNVRSEIYPEAIIAFLRENPCSGNLFNDYSLGGYLIWQLPGRAVYIDGRMPSWENGNGRFLQRHRRVYTDREFRRQEFTKYSIKCALLEIPRISKKSAHDPVLSTQLENEGWKIILQDKKYGLLINPD